MIVLGYHQQKTIDFENSLEYRFAKDVDRLDRDQVHVDCFLDLDDFYSLIKDITAIRDKHLENFNVLLIKNLDNFIYIVIKNGNLF